MLNITRKTEYGLIALAHMQNKDSADVTNTKEIAEEYGIPREILAKVLQKIAGMGLIIPVHGASGGYRLSRQLKKVNLTEFIELIEGRIGIVDCFSERGGCSQFDSCNIRTPISKINENVRKLFDSITLEEITQ
jgi:Rrf2 family protein